MSVTLSRNTPAYEIVDMTDEDFRRVIDMHIPWLRNHPSTQIIPLKSYEGYKNEGDFYGLLIEKDVPFDMHWVTRRVNNISRVGDISEKLDSLYLPDRQTILNIHQKWLERTQKNN